MKTKPMDRSAAHFFTTRVYIEDTDFNGIVYHANYFRFLERARTEIIRESDLSLTTLAAYDCHFVITDAYIRYLQPARLDDLLMISSHIENKKACSMVFNQVIYNEADSKLCEAQIKVISVDKNLKPKRLPTEVFK